MDKYIKPIHFHLPGIFEYTKIYESIVTLYTYRNNIFKENALIGSIYGSPGMHIWNGGRYVPQIKTLSEIEYIKNFMSEAQIPIRLTFTNCLIEEKHLDDTICNTTTELLHSPLNEILCNSQILETYLREKYPNYSFVSSTTKVLVSDNALNNEINKDYKLIVLDYSLNNNFNKLSKLKNKDKLEVLCNAVCLPNCPKRAEHYKNISSIQLKNDPNNLFPCDMAFSTFDVAMKHPHFISDKSINKYIKAGFSNFKLEGRTTNPLDLIEILLYYLIKEEYKPEIRTLLQKIVW